MKSNRPLFARAVLAVTFLAIARTSMAVDNPIRADIISVVSEQRLPVPAAADLVLINGRMWTGNKSQPWAEALATRGERIIAVGSNSNIRKLADQKTRVMDLQGKLAVPGFIDDHTHFIEGGFHLLSVDLREAATPEEFGRRIKDHAGKLPAGRWITGGDWDHERWLGGPLPAKELIDPHTLNNPVFVSRLDGHMALANTAALRLAGITKQTKEPPGGTIVRDPETGEPTGILKDDAMDLVYRAIPDATEAERDGALKASLAEAARAGVTSIHDITPWRDYEAYKRFRGAGRLTVRVYARTPMNQWKRQADAVARHGERRRLVEARRPEGLYGRLAGLDDCIVLRTVHRCACDLGADDR